MNAKTQPKGRLLLTLALAAAMLAASAIAKHYTPTEYLADSRRDMRLEALVPTSFGGWKLDPNITPLVVDPSQLELSDRLYSQTLARTYVDQGGHRVMLTIAYGRDQSDGLQVHTPEMCYPVAGFTVGTSTHDEITINGKKQSVVKLIANKNGEVEPITYWVTVGDYVVNNGPKGRRDVRFKYGFDGKIPDGLLFRVSSRGGNPNVEYALQTAFLDDLHKQLSSNSAAILFGSLTHEH